MNINTRTETIALSATEQGWLESVRQLASGVGSQVFVSKEVTEAADKLELAVQDFRNEMKTLAPKKKAKATA